MRSQEIDFVGEMDGDMLARQVMDTVIGNLARAVKKLASAGIENFVITADHGHQFSIRKEEDMKTDNPGGDTLDLHRRCWIGHGGTTPPGTVRVAGAELGYDTDLDFVFPDWARRVQGRRRAELSPRRLQPAGTGHSRLQLPHDSDGQCFAAPASASGSKIARPPVTNRTFGLRVHVEGDLVDSRSR